MSETSKTTRLKLRCPHCENLLDVTNIESGRKVLCIKCENVTVVPDKRTTTRRILNPTAAQKPAETAPAARPAPEPAPVPNAADGGESEDMFDSSFVDAMKDESGDSSGAAPTQLSQIDLVAEEKAQAERSEANRAVGGLRPRVTKTDGQWVDWKTIREKAPNAPKK